MRQIEDGVLKILVIDADAESCGRLKTYVEQALPGCLIAEAGSTEQALKQVSSGNWHLVVIDPTIDNFQGIELLPTLKSMTTARVLVFSYYTNAHYLLEVLRAGADGYVSKNVHLEELVAALRVLAAGKRYLSPLVIKRLGLE